MIAAPFIYISIYQDKFPDIFYDESSQRKLDHRPAGDSAETY